MSTPKILPVTLTSSIKLVKFWPGLAGSGVSLTWVSIASIKLPSITSPAAPDPPPPKISTFGNPQSSIFPVLQVTSSRWADGIFAMFWVFVSNFSPKVSSYQHLS